MQVDFARLFCRIGDTFFIKSNSDSIRGHHPSQLYIFDTIVVLHSNCAVPFSRVSLKYIACEKLNSILCCGEYFSANEAGTGCIPSKAAISGYCALPICPVVDPDIRPP